MESITNEQDRFQTIPSPLGELLMAGDGQGLTGLWFRGQRYEGLGLRPGAVPGHLPVFDEAAAWLEQYFGGGVPDFVPALAPRGTAFRRRVWEVLLRVPYGATVTYGELARLAGLPPQAARAVAGAVAHNPVSLIIPCHRVVGTRGLTGYAGGLERKAWLLSLERETKETRCRQSGTVS